MRCRLANAQHGAGAEGRSRRPVQGEALGVGRSVSAAHKPVAKMTSSSSSSEPSEKTAPLSVKPVKAGFKEREPKAMRCSRWLLSVMKNTAWIEQGGGGTSQ